MAITAAPRGLLKGRRVFYGWWMALAGFGILFYTAGVFFFSFGAVFAKILDEFGWSAAVASGAFAFQQMEQGVFGPLVGHITDRYGPRRSLLFGLSLLGVGFILLSRIQSLWQFYAAFAVLSLGIGFGSFLVVNTAVNAWFIRKRGQAMAVVSYGPGLSGILTPLVVALIGLLGWRDALLAIGVGTWAVCLPLSAVMRRSPEAYGLLPDGDTPRPPTKGVKGKDQGPLDVSFTLRQALRTATYWKYVLASICGLVFFSALIIHQFVALQSFGLSLAWTTALATGMSLASLPGRIAGGILADRFDKRKVVAVAWAVQLVGALLFVVVSGPALGVAYAAIFGFGFGLGNPPRVAILGEYFGRRSFGSLLGTQFLVTSLGTILAPIYAGAMFDLLGAMGYRIAFASLALPAVASIFLYLSMKRPRLQADTRE